MGGTPLGDSSRDDSMGWHVPEPRAKGVVNCRSRTASRVAPMARGVDDAPFTSSSPYSQAPAWERTLPAAL